MRGNRALPIILVAAVAVILCATAITNHDVSQYRDTDGMYRGYDGYYGYTLSGSTSDTYASHLERAVSDADVFHVQSALEGYPLKTIGPRAFADCTSDVIFLPSTVEAVHVSFLDGCRAGTVVFTGGIPEGVELDDGRLMTLDIFGGEVETVEVDMGGRGLTFIIWGEEAMLIDATGSGTLAIPEVVTSSNGTGCHVTAVGSDSFRSSSFTSVTIPETVVRVMDRAFYGCDSLEEVIIPESLESVEDEAFRHCTNLGDIDLRTVGFIGFEAFRDCHAFTSIRIPDTVTYLGDGAFYICTSATEVEVGAGIRSIPNRAFGYCQSLVHVTLGGNVESLGAYAFAMCSVMESADLPGVRVVGDNAFTECRLLGAIHLGAVESIGSHAFTNCRSLVVLDLPSTLERIGDGAFTNCRSLEDVWFHGAMPDMDPAMLTALGCRVHVAEGHSDSWVSYPGPVDHF